MIDTVIYSCVTGGYDKLGSGVLASEAIEESNTMFVLFTDNVDEARKYAKMHHVEWEIRPLAWKHPLCRRRTARWHKINSHVLFPHHRNSIWLDGSQRMRQIKPCHEFVDRILPGYEIATFKHPDRTCVYQELQACKKLKKDNALLMEQQIQQYRSEGYPAFNGMVETACVVRRNYPGVIEFNSLWWEQLRKHSLRDQLSFNYVAWKLNVNYGRIPGCRVKSPFFDFVPHGHG